MATGVTPPPDVARANEIWAGHQRAHDVSAFDGQSVVVDPESGEVFFGPSAYRATQRATPPGTFRAVVVVRMNAADERHLRRRLGKPWRRAH